MRLPVIILAALFLISCSESTKFKALSPKKTGITFNNTVVETDSFHVISYEYIYNGAGVGIGDLNNDNLPDIVFAGNQVSPRVYQNLGNMKFRDITSNFKGMDNSQWYSGVSLVDINGDGWLDVYLTSTAGNHPDKSVNRLWVSSGNSENNGPVYTEMAEKYGIAEKGQSVNATFFDYDLDGDLDLYVLNNTLTQRMNTSYRQKITDGSAQNNDRLFRNNGDGTFTDVTIEAGIVIEGFGLGIAVGDVNKDGYPDIYVSNDYISNDLLYINQRNGTFKNEIRKYMAYQTKSSMGDDMADVNNDGNPDMFTLDMLPEYYYKKRQTINGFSYIFYINDEKYGFEHQYLRNMLQLHNGFMNGEMLPYSEVGQMMGISASEWSWSPLFADYDNDGDKDLLITNGYPKDMTDKDWTYYKVRVLGSLADEKQVIALAPPTKVPNFAFENTGNLQFVNRNKEWLPQIPSYSYGAAFSDLDNDGDLDYVVNNLNDEAFVLRNYTVEKSGKKANYIKIKLKGKGSNTLAIGAKTEIWSGGTYQFNEHFLTRGYASSVDPVIHFGIGSNKTIDSVRITWPLGESISVVKNISANQTIELDESKSTSKDTSGLPATNQLMFSKSPDVIDYVHEQTDFIDFFQNQNIIPHKFSQIGPVIVNGDMDNDGTDDIIIGSTNKLPTTVYLRKGEQFRKTEIKGLTTSKDFSESGFAIADFDGDGDKDVAAIAGGYENRQESEYKHILYVNNNGTFEPVPLPIPSFPASVIRPCDFDQDGDMDLFIGSRVKKGMYPYSNHSWIVRNDNGKFVADSTLKLSLGMVTDAVWSDYDGDGMEDLIVTREWNSIVVLKNIGGKEFRPQMVNELEKFRGFWFSIAAGDFDGDGDQDYIAGNLGENHRFTISDKYPMTVYAIDLDLNGSIDPVSTAYWKDKDDKMKEYPINYFDELSAQSAFFKNSFTDYKDFSFADISRILDETMMKRVQTRLTANTASSYVIWNDKGTFRFEKLPRILQVSPIKRMIIRDFNSDGFADVLLGGNDYTYDVSTGYYAANKGNILLSKGKVQSFEVLTPSQTGVLLDGMVESLIYLDGENPLVLAGINRSKIEVFRQNKK
jgi:hypothetical protein